MSKDLAKRSNEQLESVNERPTVRPPVDIYENRDEYLVIADLPAVGNDDMSIHLENSHLTINGVVRQDVAASALEREFQLVNFQRSFALPEFVDRDKVSAELRHGVLTLHLPKIDAVKPKRIDVRAG